MKVIDTYVVPFYDRETRIYISLVLQLVAFGMLNVSSWLPFWTFKFLTLKLLANWQE